MNEPDVLTASIRIAASPEEVFPYLVDPSLIVQWIGDWADLNPEPGGVFALDMGETKVRGNFVAIEPPRRVVFTWGVPGRESLPEGSTTVEIVLEADGDETVVALTHRDLSAEELPRHREGWDRQLAGLRSTATR